MNVKYEYVSSTHRLENEQTKSRMKGSLDPNLVKHSALSIAAEKSLKV